MEGPLSKASQSAGAWPASEGPHGHVLSEDLLPPGAVLMLVQQ